MNKLGKVLLISPSFFSYHILIKDELEAQGYLVDWVDDRAGSGFIKKSILRFFPIFAPKLLEEKFKFIFNNIEDNKYDSVLVVKGEGISSDTINFLRKKFSKATFGLYLWDSTENSKNSLNISKYFDVVSTFDLEDSKKFKWHYRPLFCKKNVRNSIANNFEYDISFIGTVHSDRHFIINKIYERYSKKYKLFFYLYIQNKILKLYKSIFDRSIFFSRINVIKYKSLDYLKYSEVVNSSKAVLDIEHPKQNGFTMRTIETLMSGKKLITTNKNILNSDLYHPSRMLLIDRNNPLIPDEFMESNFMKIEVEKKYYYSVECWVKELINLQGKNRRFP